MIYLLYGQPASGKTTLGRMLSEHLEGAAHIDGDEFRKIFKNENYTKNGRENNIRTANSVATYLNKTTKCNVVLTLVNPYQKLREELKENNSVLEIYLFSSRNLRKEYHVKEFEVGTPNIKLNTDNPPLYTWKNLISLI